MDQRRTEGGLKAAREAWMRELVDHVMECSGADRHLARLVAHCLASYPSAPVDREGLMGALRDLWEGCMDVWKEDMEGCCDDCRKVLALMSDISKRESGENAL